ncbi:uncharacterized protein LOC117123701 [Anneissia japonica]|uniref:uncharacterized protein LOC117123701 n=1 Tax=Anneissia japonica TaxID=1529436 RepID=UPI00142590E6|nr:uncharacterized protein LOC117123701 [Anneissia japonica]
MYLKLIFVLGFACSVSSKTVDSCLFTESEHWLITLDRLHQSLTNVDQSNCDSRQCSFSFKSFLQPTQGSTYRQTLNFVTNTTEVFIPWFDQTSTISDQIESALESLKDQLEESSTNCYQTGETHQDILNSFQCIRGKSISEMGCIMRHTLRVIKRMVNQCS